MPTTSLLAVILASYLWGSLTPAFWIARRLKGIDLRHYGSGNVGSSNLGEQLGFSWMVAIGALDLLKGFAAAAFVRAWGADWPAIVLAGLATVAGHNWSLYLRFTGGRGMATALGVLFAWDVRLPILLLLIMAIGQAFKQGPLASAVGLALLAPGAWLMGDVAEVVVACALLTLLIAFKRLEANRLPLPQDPRAKRAVLWRRLWLDRDVPPDQPWEKRKRID